MKFVVISQARGIASPAFGRMPFSIHLLQFVLFKRRRRFLLHFCISSQALANALTIVLVYVQCGSHPVAMCDPSINANCRSPS